jgi:hypothetical protein
MAKKVAAERKISLGEAQLAVVRENPALYQRGIVQ